MGVTHHRCWQSWPYARIGSVVVSSGELGCWVALSQVPRLGAARLCLLQAHFDGDIQKAWGAPARELRAAGIGRTVALAVVEARRTVDPDGELERLTQCGVDPLTWCDERYPPRLKETADAPPVLYVKGTLSPADEISVAVVGTRRPTEYGRRVTADLCDALAARGVTVVSGLALGIDARAHASALDAGGRTIAVLGNGLDTVYPSENSGLARRIIEQGGALVSEFALGVRPDPSNFPRRNRIISGMTLGTLVTEASQTSGTRWTVYHALEQNREIFCVPGSVYSDSSKLTNRLIRDGAKLVTEVGDILVELGLDDDPRQLTLEIDDDRERGDTNDTRHRKAGAPHAPSDGSEGEVASARRVPVEVVDPDEAELLSLISLEPQHIDDLVQQSEQPISQVSGLLTMLELKGLIQQVGSMHYQLTH